MFDFAYRLPLQELLDAKALIKCTTARICAGPGTERNWKRKKYCCGKLVRFSSGLLEVEKKGQRH